MSTEFILLLLTAALAVCATVASGIAVLKLRVLTRESSETPGEASEMECRDV